MSNEKMAKRLEAEAERHQGWSRSYRETSPETAERFAELAESLRAGAAALREVERLREHSDHQHDRMGVLSLRNDALVGKLSRIIGAIRPEQINVNGVSYEFAPPPEIVFQFWDALSKAIRQILSDQTATTTDTPDPRDARIAELEAALAQAENLLNTPEIHDFGKAIVLEAAHQRNRWGTSHDGGKTAADWFWLIGYLTGKALHAQLAGDANKALHHIITTAAACCNWHAAVIGKTDMRPGIETPVDNSAIDAALKGAANDAR